MGSKEKNVAKRLKDERGASSDTNAQIRHVNHEQFNDFVLGVAFNTTPCGWITCKRRVCAIVGVPPVWSQKADVSECLVLVSFDKGCGEKECGKEREEQWTHDEGMNDLVVHGCLVYF